MSWLDYYCPDSSISVISIIKRVHKSPNVASCNIQLTNKYAVWSLLHWHQCVCKLINCKKVLLKYNTILFKTLLIPERNHCQAAHKKTHFVYWRQTQNVVNKEIIQMIISVSKCCIYGGTLKIQIFNAIFQLEGPNKTANTWDAMPQCFLISTSIPPSLKYLKSPKPTWY